jgi:hypothetical protein
MYFNKTKQLIKESKKIQDEIVSLEIENAQIEGLIYFNPDFHIEKINLNRGF